ncbi:MAG: MMPL family transporter [Actinomycetota bacterium]
MHGASGPGTTPTGPTRLAAELVRRAPKAILIVAGALVALSAVFAVGAPGALSPAGYEVPDSESTETAARIAATFGGGAPNVVVVATAGPAGSVDAPEVAAAGASATQALRSVDDVAEVISYWETGLPALQSSDGQQGMITARIVTDEDATYDRVRDIRAVLEDLDGALTFAVGGSAAVNLEVVEVSERDLIRAELIVFPFTTIILLVVFRSVVAALLPLIVSVIAVVGTAVVLRGLSEVTLVSIFGLNLTTALGLGMAVDYSLFLITRWREERPTSPDAQVAVLRSLHTAGRSVLFSGLTTAATLAALLVFDYPLLRSLAVSGFVVVGLATVGALVVLPAAMYLLGDRIDAGRIRALPEPRPVEEGRWYRLAQAIMRRPLLTIAGVVALLLLAGTPFLRAEFGLPDDRVLPRSEASRQVADDVRMNFPDVPVGSIAAWFEPDSNDPAASSLAAAQRLSSLDGVAAVEGAEGVWVAGQRVADSPTPDRYLPIGAVGEGPPATWFTITTVADPISSEAADVVRAMRAMELGGELLVGGEPARLVDNTAEIADKLPIVLVWIALVISVLLFVSFRSILVPLKAFLLNLLSLTASFGAIVWIFQDGRLSDVLGYTPTGLTDAQTPILMFCIAFGLSMDYEVFLLSRIREEWDQTHDTPHAVAAGLQRTGGIISAAAVLMAVVFFSFSTGDVTFIQMVGIGLAIAIVVDAFVIRTLLVPAFMALAGDWNWWTPRLRSRTSLPAVLTSTEGSRS